MPAIWGVGVAAWAVWRKQWRFAWVLLLLALCTGYYFADLHVISAIHDYYLLPFYLVTPFLVALGATQLKHPRAALLLILAIAILACRFWGLDMWFRDGEQRKPVVQHKAAFAQLTPYADLILLTTDDQSPTFTLYHLEKNGIPVPYHWLDAALFETYIRENGVRYYYSNQRSWDERPEFQRFYKRKLASLHGFHVWALKTPAELDAKGVN